MRIFWILNLAFLSQIFAEDRCLQLYNLRGEGSEETIASISCYKKSFIESATKIEKSYNLNQLSYLHFFNAQWFLENKISELEKSIEFAKKSAELFGELYDIDAYEKLDLKSKESLAMGLYLYGTAIARYVDLKGKFEAIKRMSDIKKSMNSILRIGQAPVAFYGAHRTLAIFHMKVPAIAGGKKELSAKYFNLIIDKTEFKEGLSFYPINNLMFANYFFSEKEIKKGCEQLSLIKDLSYQEILTLGNGYTFETEKDAFEAQSLYLKNKCSEYIY